MPASFTDCQGDEWKLRLTVGSVADVKREVGVNLVISGRETALLDLIFSDAGGLAALLWVLCEDQANERGLTPEQFQHRFDGPTLEAAGDAVLESIALFSPRSRIGTAIRTNLPAVMKDAETKVLVEMERLVANLSMASNSPTSAPAS